MQTGKPIIFCKSDALHPWSAEEGAEPASGRVDELEKLKELRTDFTVILMASGRDALGQLAVPQDTLGEYVDYVWGYPAEGTTPDERRRTFLHCCEEHGTPIGQCLLLDPSEEACVQFASLGGRSAQVTLNRNLLFQVALL